MKHRWMVLLLGLALTTVVLVVAPAHSADLAAPEQADPTWASTRVDAENTLAVSSRSLAIDGEDNLHAAYGSDRLYYAFSDGSGWQTTTVDYVWGTGQGRSIALDGDGLPHISYLDTHNDQLKYAYYDGAAWQIEVVAAGVASRYGWSPPRTMASCSTTPTHRTGSGNSPPSTLMSGTTGMSPWSWTARTKRTSATAYPLTSA